MSEYTNEKAPNEIVFYKDDGRLAANTMKLEPSDEVLKELYRLRAENEKLRADLAEYIAQAERGHQTMVAEACELRKEIHKLRAALKPFALSEHKIERWFGMDIPDSYNVVSQWVTVGDLRAAAAAYLGEKDD